MPAQSLIHRWHFHQRHNRKVANNLRRLNLLCAEAQSVEQILDALHRWPLPKSLRFNNRFSYLYMAASMLLLFAAILSTTGMWLLLSCGIAVLIGVYGFFSIEQPSEVDAVINQLAGRIFQLKYAIEFDQVPEAVSLNAISKMHLIAQLRLHFPHLNQGKESNRIEQFARTHWRIEDKVYPVLLLNYVYSDQPQQQPQLFNRNHTQQWGACVFDLPAYQIAISRSPQDYEDLPITWQSSDIAFNQQFYIYGQSQLALAKALTPQRTLALAEGLQQMQGSLVFDAQLQAMCYLSSQNIFMSQSQFQNIDDISDLRGHLRTLKANFYEQMQQNLSQIIGSFRP